LRVEDIVVIGAGPGGVAAAVQCRRLGISPCLIDASGEAGGLSRHAFAIENYPGLGPTPGPVFARLLGEHLERFHVGVTRAAVTGIERASGGYVVRTGGEDISAGAVIVAVGTAAREMDIPGAHHLDYTPERACAGEDGIVVIVGGGEAALDYALSITRAGAAVRILCRGARLRAEGRLVSLVRERASIDVVCETEVRAVDRFGRGYRLTIATSSSASSIMADRVVAAVGRVSRAEKMLGGLDEGPYKTVSTRLPGLFIVGDARQGALGQAGMAVGDGLGAAMAAVSKLRADRSR
jgi:thioredoxin reductase (NADPH)